MAWSEAERWLVWAHCQRLTVGAAILYAICTVCFEVWTIIFRWRFFSLRIILALMGWGRLKEVAVGWLALCFALATRYALLDASLGIRNQVPLLQSALAVMVHAATGGVIGSCFAALVGKQAQGYPLSTALLCQQADYAPHLLITGAFTAMCSCLMFVWGDKHELHFPDKSVAMGTLVVRSLKRQVVHSWASALGLGILLFVGQVLEGDFLHTRLGATFTWALETTQASYRPWGVECAPLASWQMALLTLLCASATMFLNEIGSAILKLVVTYPLNLHILAKNATQKGLSGEAFLLSALTLGRESALHALQKAADAEVTEVTNQQPSWQAEVNIQRYGVELIANNLEGKGWGRVPKVGHFEARVPLWARITRVLSFNYLSELVHLPDKKGIDARCVIYTTLWPDCLRMSLLTLDALTLQLQVYASRANPAQCRLMHGVPTTVDVAFLPEEILVRFGLMEDYRRQQWRRQGVVVTYWQDLKAARRWLKNRLAVNELHPRLTQAQIESTCSAISALSTLICHAAKEHPTSRCYNFVPVVLNSFLGCLLGIRCFTSCSHSKCVQGNRCELLPELNLISGCLESALHVVAEKYKGSIESFSFPDAYAQLLQKHFAEKQ